MPEEKRVIKEYTQRSFADIHSGIQAIKDNLEKNSLGIPRDQMPQIKGANYADFDAYLRKLGITVDVESVNIERFKIAQSQLNYDKVFHLLDTPNTMLKKPFYVSGDDYIIDGNHRFAANYLLDPHGVVTVKRLVGVPIRKALDIADKYGRVSFKGINENISHSSGQISAPTRRT